MNSFYRLSIISLIVISLFSCNRKEINNDYSEVKTVIDSIKKVYAPDKRVALFKIEPNSAKGELVLKGESDQKEAVQILKEVLSKKGVQFTDSIVLLPDTSVGETKYAVVNNSVANIRSQPRHSGELATQALLGMGLKVLKIKGDFYLVQTPDAYISWVDHGGVQLMNENEYKQWITAPKIIYTQPYGFVYQDMNDSETVSDIVLGDELKLIEEHKNYYKVEYPDQRTGYIRKTESEKYSNWIKDVKPSGELIEKYARKFVGVPYLWGGTSAKGMDCSGFTKTVYLMNGFIIPRDASQQIFAGKNIDPDLKFENLKKGDLMFFGRKATDSTRQRVTHVGIWLGNGKGEFIHASRQVRLSSINPDSPIYDEANTKRYLGSRRYLGVKDPMITNLKTDKVITEIKP